mmetsp:Transcript_70176/g.210888  ORF Transcript_70176/g.210888 Transcript_70176/m.210888 type:complete len:156 (-) Transcript_70176:31-498(-)
MTTVPKEKEIIETNITKAGVNAIAVSCSAWICCDTDDCASAFACDAAFPPSASACLVDLSALAGAAARPTFENVLVVGEGDGDGDGDGGDGGGGGGEAGLSDVVTEGGDDDRGGGGGGGGGDDNGGDDNGMGVVVGTGAGLGDSIGVGSVAGGAG